MGEHEKSSRSFEAFWEIAIVILLVGCIAVIVIPNMQCPRPRSGYACINNLRQIDAAANQFALEQNKTNGEAILFPNDLTPYIKLNSAGKIPPCPQGGIYHIGIVGKVPTCSLGSTVTPAHILP